MDKKLDVFYCCCILTTTKGRKPNDNGARQMNANQIQIEQANSQSFIRELYSAAQQILLDTDGQDDKALQVVELVEDGKYLEAVMIEMNF